MPSRAKEREELFPPHSFGRRGFLRAMVGLPFFPYLPKVPNPDSRNPDRKEGETVLKPIYWGDRKEPRVALTFDDGFNPELVRETIKILEKEGLKCTFFVIGKCLEQNPKLWQEAVKAGHQVCNHTYSHTFLNTLTPEGIKKEIEDWEKAAERVLGKEYLLAMKLNFPFIRFPGGGGHKDQKILKTVYDMGYTPIAWSAETYASVIKGYEERGKLRETPVSEIAGKISTHIVSAAQNGLIVLLHFNRWDIAALEEIIKGIIEEKKLRIVTVSDVLKRVSEPRPRTTDPSNVLQVSSNGSSRRR